jgi:hypothetical protein
MTNAMDSKARILQLGLHYINLNHLNAVRVRVADFFEHGLLESDTNPNKKDRMDWSSAQRVTMHRAIKCLDHPSMQTIDTKGTAAYLEMVHRYIDIFYSKRLTLLERVSNASYVCNFLRLWRLFIFHHADYTLGEHFISRQAFLDVTTSCHSVVLLIRAHRDHKCQHPLCFSKSGSDC